MSTKTNPCERVDPSALEDWSRPIERARCEIEGIRMMSEDLSPLQKLQTTVFLAFWMVWTGAWAFELIIPHPILIIAYALATGVAVGIYVRMHKIELEKMTQLFNDGITISTGSDEEDD